MTDLNGFRTRRCLCIVMGLFFILIASGSVSAEYLIAPEAYWRFEDDSSVAGFSGYMDEISGAANGGCRASGICPKVTAGNEIVGLAQDFGGVDDGIDVPASTAQNTAFDWEMGENFSIEFWMKRSGNPTGVEVMIGRDAPLAATNTLHWWVGILPSGEVYFLLYAQDGSGRQEISPGVFVSPGIKGRRITDGEWHHIVATRNGGENKNSLFVDGKLQGEIQPPYTAGFKSNSAELNIGWMDEEGGVGDFRYSGMLDGVALYRQDLASNHGVMRQNYLNGIAGFTLSDPVDPTFLNATFNEVAVGFDAGLSIDAAGNPAVTYSFPGDIPDAMTMDEATGLIHWVPLSTQAGMLPLTASAQSTSGTITQTLNIDVIDLCNSFMSAYWRLDQDAADPGTYTGFTDETGNAGSVGTCSGAGEPVCPTITTVDSISGKAQSFSGANDGINVAASATAEAVFDWGATESFSIEFWMKRSEMPSAIEVMIGRDELGGASLHWWIGLLTSGEVYFTMRAEDGSGSDSGIKSKVVTDGEWHHIVAVRNFDINQNLLYVDGDLQAVSQPTFTEGVGFKSTTAEMNIGWMDDEGSVKDFLYAGILDEIALYDMALTPAIVRQHADDNGGRGYCNALPKFDSNPPNPAQVDEGQLFEYTAKALDEEGDALSWVLKTAPEGMTLTPQPNGDAVISWTPLNGVSGNQNVEILVHDNFGGAAIQSFVINVKAVDGAPVIVGVKNPLSTNEDTPYTLKLDDFDIRDSDSQPADMTLIVSKTGDDNYTLKGNTVTPKSNFNGDVTVQVKVNDGSVDSAVFDATITVVAVNDAPEITSTAPLTFENDKTYRYEPTAEDAEGDTLTWALIDAPEDMTVDPQTGVVVWTPPAGVTTSGEVTLTLSDGNGGSDSETFTLISKTTDGSGKKSGGGGGGCFINTAATPALFSNTATHSWYFLMFVLILFVGNGIINNRRRMRE